MGKNKSINSSYYKYIVGFFLIFFITIIVVSWFSDGKEHGLVLYPNVSYNFEAHEFGGEYIYSGQITNNENFDMKELYAWIVDGDDNIIDATKFENIKSGETRSFKLTSPAYRIIDTEKVKFEVSSGERWKMNINT